MKDNKLKPKEKGAETSITAISALLRGENPAQSSLKEENSAQISENEDNSTHATNSKKVVKSEDVGRENDRITEFELILERLKDKDYSCKSTLYVDDEVKEVFQMLKAKGKVPIAGLVSYILEQWVLEHKSEIKDALSEKKNRFM